jgi:hypothetical protein
MSRKAAKTANVMILQCDHDLPITN